MKTLYLSLVLLVTTALCSAQDFAPIGAGWTYTQWCLSDPLCGFVSLTAVGDTMIAGKTTSIILKHYTGGDITPSNLPADSRKFLYEENKQIFMYDLVYENFKLIYDFNLNVGDSLTIKDSTESSSIFPSLPGETSFFKIRIDSIGILILNSDTLITQYTSPIFPAGAGFNVNALQYTGRNIERIGNTSNFLGTSIEMSPGGYLPRLICYNDLNINYGPAEYCTVGLNETSNEIELKFFPNLFTDRIFINGHVEKLNQITIYDITGRIVHTSKLFPFDNSIDLSSLQTGMFIISYSDNNDNAKSQIIVKQ